MTTFISQMIKKNLKSKQSYFILYNLYNNIIMENNKTQVGEKPTRKARTTNSKKSTATISPIQERMTRLETAYMSAINGEIKFGEVKSIFKKLHREIKKSAKSKN